MSSLQLSVFKTKATLLVCKSRHRHDALVREDADDAPLKDLLPSEQAKQGDTVLKAAAELLERRKRFTDRENYIMARGLLTM